jgi:hypothetical protein
LNEGSDNSAVEGKILDLLALVFSTIVISGINIAISGHILGYVLNLDTSGDNHFTIPLPPVLRLEVKGSRVVAGFCAFSLSLLLVGVFLPGLSREVFIERLQATDSRWTAAQSLAAILSVALCVIAGSIKAFAISLFGILAQRKEISESPEERARRLASR